jgi:hypothetical protein
LIDQLSLLFADPNKRCDSTVPGATNTPRPNMSAEHPSRDQALLAQSLAMLREHSMLEYTGEFGAEVATFIPFVAWLKQEGHLSGRRVVTYAGMRPYYFFLDESEFEGRKEPRRWLPPSQRHWPSNATWTATPSPWQVYPDYRRHFARSGRAFHRPVLFIQNKFTVEWGEGPINYIPLTSLRRLLELTVDAFDVVYSRPRGRTAGYSYDDNAICEYPDRAIIRQFAQVIDFEDACQSASEDYNQAKLEVLAKSHLFVAAQGGGAHLLAYFGPSLLLLLHNAGPEYPHAYQHGPYKYLSPTPPRLLVAKNTGEFKAGIEIVGNARVQDSKLLLPASAMDTVERLSL